MQVNRLSGANGYQHVVATIPNVVNVAGSGAGVAVTVTISNLTDQFGGGLLPPNGAYTVTATPSQNCAASISAKTNSGFVLTLTPPSGVTLAAGTTDILIHS
jgi:hypothetical protein